MRYLTIVIILLASSLHADERTERYDNHTSSTWVLENVFNNFEDQQEQRYTKLENKVVTKDDGTTKTIPQKIQIVIPEPTQSEKDAKVLDFITRFKSNNPDPKTLPDTEFEKLRKRIVNLEDRIKALERK